MYIGKAAQLSGTTVKTIRHYEAIGLLPTPKRQGQYRVYNQQSVELLTFIKCAQQLGFKLKELQAILLRHQGADLPWELAGGNPHLIHQGKYRQTFRILARERLLPALKTFPADANTWKLPVTATDQGFTPLLNEVCWCGKATVEGLTYLAVTASNETCMEMLVDNEDENFIGLFFMHVNPGGSDFNLGRQPLTSIEQNLIRSLLTGLNHSQIRRHPTS